MTTRLEVDTTYGGVYAGTSLEISAAAAGHLNRAAARAANVLEGEFVPFQAGHHVSIACPMAAAHPREAFLEAYHELRVVLDGRVELRLADYPRLFSNHTADWTRFRAVPTYVPKSALPAGFFGAPHQVELFQGGERVFGPVERFFHSERSGCVFSQVEDGHGRLVVEARGNLDALARTGMVIVFTDPVFGEPLGAAQVGDDGAATSLRYTLLGKDHVGDVMLFNEGLVSGVAPRGERVVIELYLPGRGSGLAAALYSGHTRDTAFRADATVL